MDVHWQVSSNYWQFQNNLDWHVPGDEIARELGNFKIIYGVRAAPPSQDSSSDDSRADWHVGVIAESEGYGHAAEEGWRPAAMFPGGRYDGAGYAEAETSSRSQSRHHQVSDVDDDQESDSDESATEAASLLRKARL